MPFYVTLPSHSNRGEFPNNQANWFKIRLPQPLQLGGDQWYVGLSSISLPDTGVDIFQLVPRGHAVFGNSGYRKTSSATKFENFNMKMEDLKDDPSIVNGVTFMKAYLRWLDQKMTQSFETFYGSVTDDGGKHTCALFKWNGENLQIDNKNVARKKLTGAGSTLMPHFAVNGVLAEKMGWFKETKNGVFVKWELGTNLKMSYIDGKVPSKNEIDFKDASGNPLYWKVTKDSNDITWIWLNMKVNWEFINLNVAFRSIVKEPTRSLHVYSNVGGSSIVGNRITDLLREIKFKREGRGVFYFEPLHIQYLPVRYEVIEFIEVQVAETSGAGGDLVKFVEGNTILTLHFKKG